MQMGALVGGVELSNKRMALKYRGVTLSMAANLYRGKDRHSWRDVRTEILTGMHSVSSHPGISLLWMSDVSGPGAGGLLISSIPAISGTREPACHLQCRCATSIRVRPNPSRTLRLC